jgi:hypothetical protein
MPTMLTQALALLLLVVFAGTFGVRWAVLALALVLVLVSFALSSMKKPADEPSGEVY